MKRILAVGLLSVVFATGGIWHSVADDQNCAGAGGGVVDSGSVGVVGGGSRQKGRIITRVNRSFLGASAAPVSAIAVQHVPAMSAAPYVMTMQAPFMGAAYPAYMGYPNTMAINPVAFNPMSFNGFGGQSCGAQAFNPGLSATSCSGQFGAANNVQMAASNNADIIELRAQMKEIRDTLKLALEEIQKRPVADEKSSEKWKLKDPVE